MLKIRFKVLACCLLAHPGRNALFSLLAPLVLSSCMTARVEESKDASTGIGTTESVVVLASSYHTSNPAEDAFLNCITDKIQGGKRKMRVHPSAEFRDALYPWLEPRTAPRNAEALPALLERPGVSQRIRDRDIRYIIWIQGDTERTSGGGSLSCAAGPGGGGCFGLAWWENLSSYEATIWDLDGGIRAGKVSTDVNGTSVIPAVVIPLPLIARTRAAACKGLARQLQTFIVGQAPTG
ncbi:MAG: hypothetical protein P8Y61_06320 [Gammaproteobacteria bacterium]